MILLILSLNNDLNNLLIYGFEDEFLDEITDLG